MKVYFLVLLLQLLHASNGEDISRNYTTADIKRFEKELRRLGVVLPSPVYEEEPSKSAEPAVSSAAGDFEGYWTKSRFGRLIAAFEGIPYAQPPVGRRRFSVAEPHAVLKNFKAKKPGHPCIQRDGHLRHKRVNGNEDCLFLNVYVPKSIQRSEAEKLPVIFFIYGGGFLKGQGDVYKSNILLDRDVLLVTFNYRMGPLGFLTTTDGVIPGNIGLKDQLAALRWVNENIGAFGGNPDLITIYGVSSGAASAELLMLSPLSKGLIKRVVLLSGSSFGSWIFTSPEEIQRNVQKFASSLECPKESSVALLSCLRNKTAEDIALADFNFPAVWRKLPVVPFKPVIEGDVPGAIIPRHPKDLYNAGLVNDVPDMVSVSSEEGAYFTLSIFTNETSLRELDENFVKYVPEWMNFKLPNQKRVETIDSLRRAYFTPGPLTKSNFYQGTRLLTDIYFLWPASQSALLHSKMAKSPTYFYYMSFENAQTHIKLPPGCSRKHLGASHGDDLFYIYPLPSEQKPTAQDVYLSFIMTELLSSFARDGVPSSSCFKSQWLPITKTNTTDFDYLHIKSPMEISMKKNLFPERRSLLEKLLEAN